MGRYYQTAAPEFVQDIMYRPPWELAKEVLQKEQGDYDTAVEKANLFRDVDIQFIDTPIERENAERIRQELAQQADAVTQQLEAGTADDWRKAMPNLTKMGRDLASRYKTGDISQIENSAAQYAAMNKHLETIKDPIIRQRAKEDFLNKFNQQARGSLDGTFKYDQVYDKKEYMKDFLEEQSKSNPDIVTKLNQYRAKGYLNTTTETEKFKKDYGEAFQNYISSRGLEPYFQQQQSFGLGQYTDEKGQMLPVTDPRSSLSADLKYAEDFNYSQVDKDLKSEADQLYMMNLKRGWDLQDQAAAANAARQTMLSGPTTEAIVTTTEQIQKLNERYYAGVNALGRKYKVKPGPDGMPRPGNIEAVIKSARRNPKLNAAAKAELTRDLAALREARSLWRGNKARAGFVPFGQVYGPEEAAAAQAQMLAKTKDPRGLLPLKGDVWIKGNFYRDTSIDQIKKNPKAYGFNPAEVEALKDENSYDPDVAIKMYIEDSAAPVMIGENPEDWNYNEIQTKWSMAGVPVTLQNNFETLGIESSSGQQKYKINKKK